MEKIINQKEDRYEHQIQPKEEIIKYERDKNVNRRRRFNHRPMGEGQKIWVKKGSDKEFELEKCRKEGLDALMTDVTLTPVHSSTLIHNTRLCGSRFID